MNENAREKVMKILRRELKYTSTNLAFNMLISNLQRKLQADPGSMDACMTEMEGFLKKDPIVAKVDLANIAAL